MSTTREEQAEDIFLAAMERIEQLGVEVHMDCSDDNSIQLINAPRFYRFVATEELPPPEPFEPRATLEIEEDRFGFYYFVFRYWAPKGKVSSLSFSWRDDSRFEHIQEISRQFSKSIQKSLHSIKT